MSTPLPATPAGMVQFTDLSARHGLIDYVPLWHTMRAYTDQRNADSPDHVLLLQHRPVFTLGQAGKPEHVLLPGDIPVLQCDRGGQVTYHGPGQLVLYPLLDLQRLGLGVRALVTALEQVVLDTLAGLQVCAERRDGMPGVYVDGRKIAALGLRIRRGCSYHGLAFNVDMDLEPFARINPCGYRDLQVTDLRRCRGGRAVDIAAVQQQLLDRLQTTLGLTLATASTDRMADNVFSDCVIDYSS